MVGSLLDLTIGSRPWWRSVDGRVLSTSSQAVCTIYIKIREAHNETGKGMVAARLLFQ